MKRWIWHISIIFVLMQLFACSRPQKIEPIIFEDMFYSQARYRYNQLIDQTLPLLDEPNASPFELLPGIYGVARMYWMLKALVPFNQDVQKALVDQLALYADIPNAGAGAYLYLGLLSFKALDKKTVQSALQRTLRISANDTIRQLARAILAVMENRPVRDGQYTNTVVKFIGTYVYPWYHFQKLSLPEILGNIQSHSGQTFLNSQRELLKPLFTDKITDTSEQAIIKTIQKKYFNPFLYELFLQLYQNQFEQIANIYVQKMSKAWIQELDSTDLQALFYLNYYLAETAALFSPSLSKKLLTICELVPGLSPLMMAHIKGLQALLSNINENDWLFSVKLTEYSPFYTAYLKARFLRIATHRVTLEVPLKKIEDIKRQVLELAPDENYRNQTLALLGESACPIARWEIAIQLLSPTFDRGYDAKFTDPVKLVFLASAFFHRPLQMDGGKGILEALLPDFPILQPLRYDYIRLLSYLYAK